MESLEAGDQCGGPGRDAGKEQTGGGTGRLTVSRVESGEVEKDTGLLQEAGQGEGWR